MKKVELPTGELTEELQRHLKEKGFAVESYDKGRRTIQFHDGMEASQWSSLTGEVERWAGERHLDVVDSIKLEARKSEAPEAKPGPEEHKVNVKEKVDRYTPQQAEERYSYLSKKSISELTDAEYEERLALAQRAPEKSKGRRE